MEYYHKTVLLNETVSSLNIKPNGIYIDSTFGGGGHTRKIIEDEKTARVIGIDQDIDAIKSFLDGKDYEYSKQNGTYTYKNITLVHDNFSNIKNILDRINISSVDGILADLGVSSYQLDNKERGFSFMQDSFLDMRMDQSKDFKAYDVVNEYSFSELKRILIEYGEEKWADRIAKIIVERREIEPIKTTFQLVDIVNRAIPKKLRDKNKNSATRTFQAIRIEVNSELSIISDFIKEAFEYLNINGRMSIITFHSLEDKIVKKTFKSLAKGCICPKDFPVCVCGNEKKAKIITNKPILPSTDEVEKNPRSRSAKLRVISKER